MKLKLSSQQVPVQQKILGFIIMALILVVFFWSLETCGRNLRAKRKSAIERNKKSGIAKVVDKHYMKGNSVKYLFHHNGVEYKNWQNDYDEKFKVGGCYEVIFDSTSPETAILKLNEQVCP